ncbi:hypothetical protein Tsp_05979 [Trichinella spiralis]|nr:hypothetical protein Tsp_05979 [Trichinella spiralis]
MLCMLLFLYGEWKLTDCKLATPSAAARLLLYSYVQRNVNVQDNTTQYMERVWFDYCSVHVSTVISHVSQRFRFLVFFIVTQWVVSVQWNYFYELEYLSLMVVRVSLNGLKRCTKICKNGLHHQHRVDVRSYSCVSLSWLNAVTQYWSRNLCGFAYHRSTIHHTSLLVRVAISAFGEYFCRPKGNMQIFICPKATP